MFQIADFASSKNEARSRLVQLIPWCFILLLRVLLTRPLSPFKPPLEDAPGRGGGDIRQETLISTSPTRVR